MFEEMTRQVSLPDILTPLTQNTYHPILPFCYFTLKVGRESLKMWILRTNGWVDKPQNLGQHLRNRRLMSGLRQRDVAERLNTQREVYERWERDEREPVVSKWPGILSYLGYYPERQETSGDLVLKARRYQGLGQTRMAAVLGLDHEQVRRWEHGGDVPNDDILVRLRALAQ